MFSKDKQYIINQLQQDIFNKQLPSTSQKVWFKKDRQKILNVNQTKLQLELLKEQIYQKCKLQELKYLDLLEMEKKRFKLFKQEKEKIKDIYWNDYMKKKYVNKKEEENMKKSKNIRDSLDDINPNLIMPPTQKNKPNLQFSLQPKKEKLIEQQKQQQWVNRVKQARKVMQKKFGKYYEDQLYPNQQQNDQISSYTSNGQFFMGSSRSSISQYSKKSSKEQQLTQRKSNFKSNSKKSELEAISQRKISQNKSKLNSRQNNKYRDNRTIRQTVKQNDTSSYQSRISRNSSASSNPN